MSAGRRTLKLVLVNLGVLALGVLVVELALGQWLRPRNRVARLNLIVDKTISFDIRRLYRDGYDEAIYKRDRFGFRGSYPDPGRIDILTIGGSTTDQRYITEGKTWQDVIAREFRRAGKNVSVVNAGVDGQSTYGHLKNFDWWFPSVPDLRVKYFLFYVGINDFYVAAANADVSPKDALKPDRTLRAIIEENSALYYLRRTIDGVARTSRFGAGHKPVNFSKVQWTSAPKQSAHAEIMEKHLETYEGRVKALLERSRRLGAEPICVTQATRHYKIVDGTVFGRSDARRHGDGEGEGPRSSLFDEHEINGVDFYYMLGLLNQVTLDVCRGAGALAIDVGRDVEWEDADFYNWTHNTPRGAEKLGSYLYANLKHLF